MYRTASRLSPRFAPCVAAGFTPRLLLLPAALASAFAFATWSLPAAAQSAPVPVAASLAFNLPAGPLVTTLDAIGAASGRAVVFDRTALASGQANAVRGNLSPAAAVAQALSGTGFVVNQDGAGALTVTGTAQVVVAAKRDEAETSFKASRSDTATRSGTSLHLVPGSVTVITGRVLESQQATDITAALRNVSGVSFNQSPQSPSTIGIRGFQASATSNGVTDSHAATRGIFTVERIEVLKGPQAILSGGDSLGGGVNIVVKKPQAETIRDLTMQYGTHDDKTVAVDLSGKVTHDPRLTYRTIASVADARSSDSGMSGREEKSFMQALRWKDERTDLTAGFEYTEAHSPLMRYTFALRSGEILPVPDRLMGHPDDGFDVRNRRLNYQLERQLSENVTLISRAQHTRENFDLHAASAAGLTYAAGAAPDAPRPNIDFYASRTQKGDETTSGDHYLRIALDTGPVRHKISAGFNHTNFKYYQYQTTGTVVQVPVYSTTPYAFQDQRERATRPSSDQVYGQKQQAVYVQDMLSYGKWNLLLNARRTRYALDDASATYFTSNNFVLTTPGRTSYSTTPGAGIVYQLNDQVALYASYAEGFVPRTTTQCGGGVVPPNLTRNREVGAKFDLLESRFSLTTSLFSLQQSNMLLYNQAQNCYDVRDAQRTKGFELDAQGRLAPGFETVFNYAYTRIEDVVQSATVFTGQPKHKMSLWALYDFQSPALKGFGAGLGIKATSNTLGSSNPAYQFTLPGQAQVDASVNWRGGPWRVTFGVRNVFDRTLYSTTNSNSFVPLLPGREAMLTVMRSFQ